eukprot:sb/3478492/
MHNHTCTVAVYKYSRTPIYRDPRGKGFCPVNRGARYIGMKFLYRGKFILPVNRGSGISGPGKSGFDCIYINKTVWFDSNASYEKPVDEIEKCILFGWQKD